MDIKKSYDYKVNTEGQTSGLVYQQIRAQFFPSDILDGGFLLKLTGKQI